MAAFDWALHLLVIMVSNDSGSPRENHCSGGKSRPLGSRQQLWSSTLESTEAKVLL
jgi:hypothetical protein